MKNKYTRIHISTFNHLKKHDEITMNLLNNKNYDVPKDFPNYSFYWKRIPLYYFSVGNLILNNERIKFKSYIWRFVLITNPTYNLDTHFKFSYELKNIKSIDKYIYRNNNKELNMIKLDIKNMDDSLLIWAQSLFLTSNITTEVLFDELTKLFVNMK